MAPTRLRIRAFLSLSVLFCSVATIAFAQDSLAIVESLSEVDAGLFEYDYPLSDLDDPLPSPIPADYEQLSEEEISGLFKRRVDGDEHAKKWHGHKRALGPGWTGTSSWRRAGTTGVGAMQITVVDDDNIVIFDKAEDNPLQVKGHSAWGSVYRISTGKVRALDLKTNSFCAGGGWISNGTLVSVGGNPPQEYMNDAAGDGLAAVRLFTPCSNNKCDVQEWPSRVRLTSARWYPTSTRLTDGSLIIVGGMIAGGYNNDISTDNPTIEFYPPKGNGLQIYSAFLHDALKSNLFPVLFTLPNGQLFVAANKMAMIYDPVKNTEYRLPDFPNGVTVTYPASAASALLPLTVANKWTPEVLFCGGTTANLDLDPWKISAKVPASRLCSRMVLDARGIKGGWKTSNMPSPRVMGDFVNLPDGKLILINGAQQGIAGYGNVKDEIGASNAREPNFQPLLYDPNESKPSARWSTAGMPKSKIERLYHSSATLLPSGEIWIAGSNPNDKVSKIEYASRYEVEILAPPYIKRARPSFTKGFARLTYNKSFTITVNVPKGSKSVRAVVMDLGYSTHGVHFSQRLVELVSTWNGSNKLKITGPATTGIFPPGPGWLYLLADDIPSAGQKVMVGQGLSPPVSQAAINNMLKYT
ncbi:uncharacterized protein JCM15063_005705 [Sporobolomyces koalae]|uniref:uncharacterized protein n=1 Tax=Sporobolomyces koalae TaxID=500713 RepID=UPI00317FE28D